MRRKVPGQERRRERPAPPATPSNTTTIFITDVEDFDEYCAHRDDYMTSYGRDQVECDLVERIAHAEWNLKRRSAMEHELINARMCRMQTSLDREYEGLSPHARMALALEQLAKEPAMALLERYKTRASNEYNRALKTLRELRRDFPLLAPGAPAPEAPAAEAPPHHTDQTAPVATPQPSAPSGSPCHEPRPPARHYPGRKAVQPSPRHQFPTFGV